MPAKLHDDRLTAYHHVSNHKIIVKNFLGGIAWGVGSVIGATVIISFIVWVLSSLDFLPFASGLIDEITREISTYSR